MTPPDTAALRAVVVGGGPGGLMAAEVLATAGAVVTVFEHMPSVGRKLLLAGRGGLNLTHSEPIEQFLTRYSSTGGAPGARAVCDSVRAFDATALRSWCEGLGQTTFVGSSGRVFPSAFRATDLLHAWLERLRRLGVEIRTSHRWLGWSADGEAVVVQDAEQREHGVVADVVVLSLGGASWPRVGSDGSWQEVVEAAGIRVQPLRPANVGFEVDWSPGFAERFEGVPLKNVGLSAGGRSVRGELMVVGDGVEGGGVYALGRELREEHARRDAATLTIDLQPDLTVEQLEARIAKRRPKDSTSTVLRRHVGLSPVAVGVLREATANQVPRESGPLAELVSAVPLQLRAPEGLERAISTAGGIDLDELDEHFMLRRRPGTFVAGEMLDWEAPTGGYLLQATFATAVTAAQGALAWGAVGSSSRTRAPG